MRLGIIDLGTNSVRFDVHQLGPGKGYRRVHREKLMIRLGQGVFVRGRLDPAAVKRAIQAFRSFAETARDLRVTRLVAMGTSALREAEDTRHFLEEIRRRTGIEVNVISGVEEARLIALGILSNEKLPRGPVALIDIGGGSTEISIRPGGRRKNCTKIAVFKSFPLGVARLQQVFLRQSPPSARSIAELRKHVRSVLLPEIEGKNWPGVERVIGSSGTIRTVARMLTHGRRRRAVELKDLRRLNLKLAELGPGELLQVPGMEPRRVDLIFAGSLLLEECLDALGARKFVGTEYSLRDGVLVEEKQVLRKQLGSRISFHLEEISARAASLGRDPKRLTRVIEFARELFARLRAVHRLDVRWLNYLLAAVCFRDVGEGVAMSHHAEHSAYIVRHADIPSLESWERQFVAELCLHHEGLKPQVKRLPFARHPRRRKAFQRLLALLRVIDALDSGRPSSLHISRVRVSAGGVRLSLSGAALTDLELLRLEQKKALFEGLFGRALVVERV